MSGRNGTHAELANDGAAREIRQGAGVDHLGSGGQGDGQGRRHRIAGAGDVEDGHGHGWHVSVHNRAVGLLAAKERDAFRLAGDGHGPAGLLDEQAAGRLETFHVRDWPLGGHRGLLEVGRQHGRAGVAAVITPRRVDDNRRSLPPGSVQGGGNDLGTEHALAVIFQDHGIGLGRGVPGGLRQFGPDLRSRDCPALAVHPQELLVVRDEPGLDRGGSARVRDQTVADVRMSRQQGLQVGGGRRRRSGRPSVPWTPGRRPSWPRWQRRRASGTRRSRRGPEWVPRG